MSFYNTGWGNFGKESDALDCDIDASLVLAVATALAGRVVLL